MYANEKSSVIPAMGSTNCSGKSIFGFALTRFRQYWMYRIRSALVFARCQPQV